MSAFRKPGRAKAYFMGRPLEVTNVQISNAAEYAKLPIFNGATTEIQMEFKLQLVEDPMPSFRKLCAEYLLGRFGKRLRGHEVHVDDATDECDKFLSALLARSSILVRVVPFGMKRSIGNMSFNYYHRDREKLGAVKTRLLKRLEKYAAKLDSRLRTPEQLAEAARRKAAAEASRPARVAKAIAEADRVFDELEKET